MLYVHVHICECTSICESTGNSYLNTNRRCTYSYIYVESILYSPLRFSPVPKPSIALICRVPPVGQSLPGAPWPRRASAMTSAWTASPSTRPWRPSTARPPSSRPRPKRVPPPPPPTGPSGGSAASAGSCWCSRPCWPAAARRSCAGPASAATWSRWPGAARSAAGGSAPGSSGKWKGQFRALFDTSTVREGFLECEDINIASNDIAVAEVSFVG
jgi:hypothetical protein